MVYRLGLLIWLSFLPLPAQAGGSRTVRGSVCFYSVVQALKMPVRRPGGIPLERAAELEIELPRVLPHLTTTDGTLAPLVPDPESVGYRRMFGEIEPRNVEWDSLTDLKKEAVINAATEGQRFFRDRVIHGLKIREGEGPLRDFEPYVELGSPEDPGQVRGVELHLRQAQPAATVGLRARAAARALGRPMQHLHVHVPLPIRELEIRRAPVEEVAKHVDYVRRLELFSQMLLVAETNYGLNPPPPNERGSVDFDVMRSPDDLLSLASDFADKAKGNRLVIRTKDAVGVRGENGYDQPGLWGVEVRTIPRSLSNDAAEALLHGVEKTGLDPRFGLEPGRVRKWLVHRHARLETRYIEDEVQVLENQLPRLKRDLRDMDVSHFEGPESELWAQLRAKFRSPTQSPAEKKTGQSKLLNFMFHAWERDILFYDSGEARERVRRARVSAMRKILRDDPMQNVAREFLLDSGVYPAFAKSLGIDIQVLAP